MHLRIGTKLRPSHPDETLEFGQINFGASTTYFILSTRHQKGQHAYLS